MGRAQVMLSVDDIAREKSVFGMKPFGEESEDEPMLSTVAGYSEGAIGRYVICSDCCALWRLRDNGMGIRKGHDGHGRII